MPDDLQELAHVHDTLHRTWAQLDGRATRADHLAFLGRELQHSPRGGPRLLYYRPLAWAGSPWCAARELKRGQFGDVTGEPIGRRTRPASRAQNVLTHRRSRR